MSNSTIPELFGAMTLEATTYARIFQQILPPTCKSPADVASEILNEISKKARPSLESWEIVNCFSHVAQAHPGSIDRLLTAYDNLISRLPEDEPLPDSDDEDVTTLETLRGQEAGIAALVMHLTDMIHTSPAHVDRNAADKSGIYITKEQVDVSQDSVIEAIMKTATGRRDRLIWMAITGRAHARGILKMQGSALGYIIGIIDRALKVDIPEKDSFSRPRWSKIDFLAACVLFQSCNKSIFEGIKAGDGEEAAQTRMQKWEGDIRRFLWDPVAGEGDLTIKLHAAAILKCFNDGFRDQETEEIFSSLNWIF